MVVCCVPSKYVTKYLTYMSLQAHLYSNRIRVNRCLSIISKDRIYYIDLPKYTLILYTWVIIYWIIKEKASSFPHILNLNYLAGR